MITVTGTWLKYKRDGYKITHNRQCVLEKYGEILVVHSGVVLVVVVRLLLLLLLVETPENPPTTRPPHLVLITVLVAMPRRLCTCLYIDRPARAPVVGQSPIIHEDVPHGKGTGQQVGWPGAETGDWHTTGRLYGSDRVAQMRDYGQRLQVRIGLSLNIGYTRSLLT